MSHSIHRSWQKPLATLVLLGAISIFGGSVSFARGDSDAIAAPESLHNEVRTADTIGPTKLVSAANTADMNSETTNCGITTFTEAKPPLIAAAKPLVAVQRFVVTFEDDAPPSDDPIDNPDEDDDGIDEFQA